MGDNGRRGEDNGKLRVSVERVRGWTVARLAGEIDLLTGPGLRTHLVALVADHGGRPRVVIDLGDVTFCDAHGLGVLVGAQRSAVRRGGTVRVVVPEGGVRRMLRVTRPTHDLEVHGTIGDAVAPR